MMKTTIRISALVAALLFGWYLVMDRATPYTSNARIKAVEVDAVPQVSGQVAAVAVRNGQIVEPNQLLARIDPRPFQFQVVRAQAALQSATQSVGATSSGVEAAQANLTEARVRLANVTSQSQRILPLEQQGVVSHMRADELRANLGFAHSAVARSEAELERAQRTLGEAGANNPAIRSALAELGAAQLSLEWTEIRAPSRGMVVNVDVAEGTFARAGSPLLTFISFDEVWVEAYFTENNLGRIAEGQRAEMTLDMYPGRIFAGTVASITRAAAAGGASRSGAPVVRNQQAWMRDAQRFPVRIAMTEFEVGSETHGIHRFLNGQADVVVFTTDNGLLTSLVRAWLWLNAWISYAY